MDGEIWVEETPGGGATFAVAVAGSRGQTVSRILVVDDEEQILRALRRALAARGYEVVTAPDGEDAIAEVEVSMPDLVVLDLNLPGIDGMEVCRRLRTWTQVPILILSVREDEAGKVQALDLGADDYLTKPFGVDELLARVRALLRRSRPPRERRRRGSRSTGS